MCYFYDVSKASLAQQSIPPSVRSALLQLGKNLAIARKRRRESQRTWASRIGISIPTVRRLEHGDPTVAMGNYATALWMMGRVPALLELADPQHDLGALESDLRKIRPSAQTRQGRRRGGV